MYNHGEENDEWLLITANNNR